MSDTCIFCEISNGKIPGEILYSDDSCFVLKDIAPKAETHLLIIPKQHFTYLTNITSDFYSEIGNIFNVAQKMARQEGIIGSGYRLVINQGDHAGQMVPHLHIHLLGGNPLGDMV